LSCGFGIGPTDSVTVRQEWLELRRDSVSRISTLRISNSNSEPIAAVGDPPTGYAMGIVRRGHQNGSAKSASRPPIVKAIQKILRCTEYCTPVTVEDSQRIEVAKLISPKR